jgi:hypothetical protein
MFGRSRRDFESEPGSIPVGTIAERERHGAVPDAGAPAVLFLPAITVRQVVGISVGIGNNPRRKLLHIQMVMRLDDCRPGPLNFR